MSVVLTCSRNNFWPENPIIHLCVSNHESQGGRLSNETPKKNRQENRDVVQILAADVAGKPKKKEKKRLLLEGDLERLGGLSLIFEA